MCPALTQSSAEWRQFLRRFPPESANSNVSLDRITTLAARVFRVDGVSLSVLDDESPRCLSRSGLMACSDPQKEAEPFAPRHSLQSPHAPALPRTLPSGLYCCAEIPLRHHDGAIIGILRLFDRRPRVFTVMDRASLDDMASLIVSELARQMADHSLAESKEQIARLAWHNTLTGLPNRRHFADCLEATLHRTGRPRRPLGVLFLDLDRFKVINDSLGQRSGDLLLQYVAHRLRDCLSADDTVAHLGGDEYVILLPELLYEEGAERVAQQIREALKPPFFFEDNIVYITASIGISVFPTDGQEAETLLQQEAETLLQNAEIAMYRAKQQGRDGCQLFTPTMNQSAAERLALETCLHQALENDEFVLHYHPQVDLKTGEIIGAEALTRWQRGENDLVPPGEFIPLAEETGLIVPMGLWALRTACKQAAEWRQQTGRKLPVAVNLSLRQFQQNDLVSQVAQTLLETDLDPECLELEITESLAMEDVDANITLLRELKALGVRVSLDDFGTGYSSLNYLKRLPIDTLKIDRSFVRMITTDPRDAAIATGIITMAHSLHLSVVAEGVDKPEQLVFLREQSCDTMQGFLFSKPLPAAQFAELLDLESRMEVLAG